MRQKGSRQWGKSLAVVIESVDTENHDFRVVWGPLTVEKSGLVAEPECRLNWQRLCPCAIRLKNGKRCKQRECETNDSHGPYFGAV
jgi:hypothetical protein